MHRLPSSKAVTRLTLASWGLFLMWLLIPAALGFTTFGLFLMDTQLLGVALYLIGATLILGMIQWMISANIRCPLCLARLMLRQRCSKHRKAKDLLGSYRLRVATTVIFNRNFSCPYCGESTLVAARSASSASKISPYRRIT
jgi:DNA-directed RNA polymerase subunit RPC12/RpoP